jgi:subtilisin
MAQEKDDRSSVSRKAGDTSEDTTRRIPGVAARSIPKESVNGGRESGNGGSVRAASATRRQQYLIGVRAAGGAHVFGSERQSMDVVVDYLGRQENIEIVRRMELSRRQPLVADGSAANEVVVARMEESQAERIRATGAPLIIIEPDAFLSYADTWSVPLGLAEFGAMLPLRSVAADIAVRVLGERDQPLARATVLIYGPGFPVQAVTDDTGVAHLPFFGGLLESVQAICVRAPANHWDRFIPAPRLDDSSVYTIRLRPLTETFRNFPTERLVGWGQRLMRLDQSGAPLTGNGVRIGLIDSGCDNSHPLLRHITRGKDFSYGGSDSSWTTDPIAHGTHCAGIVSAAGAQGIAGCAPEAEVHVFKVFPGGRVSDLLAALDECIVRELDIINISVGSDVPSELVSFKLQEARQKGIAAFVAAGNSGGPVRFPALLPGVTAVGAVGRIREFPADSSHALSVIPQLVGADGIFAAKFSSNGPQIAMSAPGVAVVSTVPGAGYGAADGTSVAASHITGLAALILAHHPLFQGSLKMRSEQRVDVLSGLLRASAVPHFADSLRGGAGVPDLQRVPGEQGLATTGAPLFSPGATFLFAPSGLMQMRAAGFY